MKKSTKKLVLTAVFAAIAVLGSTISIPIFGAKASPVQHIVNVLSAVLLGPGPAMAQAFLASLLRNIFGLGTLLAFPGSMCGALLAGFLYQQSKKLAGAYFGEVFGTGIIGGLLSYPIAYFIMDNKAAALTTFVLPFLISTVVGTVIALIILSFMKKNGSLDRMQIELKEDRK